MESECVCVLHHIIVSALRSHLTSRALFVIIISWSPWILTNARCMRGECTVHPLAFIIILYLLKNKIILFPVLVECVDWQKVSCGAFCRCVDVWEWVEPEKKRLHVPHQMHIWIAYNRWLFGERKSILNLFTAHTVVVRRNSKIWMDRVMVQGTLWIVVHFRHFAKV